MMFSMVAYLPAYEIADVSLSAGYARYEYIVQPDDKADGVPAELPDLVRERFPVEGQSMEIAPMFACSVPFAQYDHYLNGYFRYDRKELGLQIWQSRGQYDYFFDEQQQYGYTDQEFLIMPEIAALDVPLLQALSPYVVDGTVDIDAINRGDEIVLCMPDYAATFHEDDNSYGSTYSPLWADPVITENTVIYTNTNWEAGDTLTFTGVTAIADSDTTADYSFGYADVTPNGSPDQYGDAVNPYTPYTSDKTGGDGFDLEWAVDISTGLPVDVTGKTFHYVRVYSAVLDFGRFGETSAEITGIFTTANKADSSVLRTGKPTKLTFQAEGKGASTIFAGQVPTTGSTVTKISDIRNRAGDAEAVNVTINAPSGSTVYINNTCLTESSTGVFTGAISTPAADQYLRVIVQNGEMSPYMFVIV